MAGTAPQTRNWHATEMTDLVGRNGKLTVTGDVLIIGTGTTARLVEHTPQGINKTIFLLDLDVTTTSGPQGDIARWETLNYERKSSGHQYKEVDILFDGQIMERITVEHPVTLAARSVKKPAKKSAKKPAKKSTKKPAKKPAKKQAKKRTKKRAKK